MNSTSLSSFPSLSKPVDSTHLTEKILIKYKALPLPPKKISMEEVTFIGDQQFSPLLTSINLKAYLQLNELNNHMLIAPKMRIYDFACQLENASKTLIKSITESHTIFLSILTNEINGTSYREDFTQRQRALHHIIEEILHYKAQVIFMLPPPQEKIPTSKDHLILITAQMLEYFKDAISSKKLFIITPEHHANFQAYKSPSHTMNTYVTEEYLHYLITSKIRELHRKSLTSITSTNLHPTDLLHTLLFPSQCRCGSTSHKVQNCQINPKNLQCTYCCRANHVFGVCPARKLPCRTCGTITPHCHLQKNLKGHSELKCPEVNWWNWPKQHQTYKFWTSCESPY